MELGDLDGALADAIEFVYQYPKTSAEMAKQGSELVKKEFNLQTNIFALSDLMRIHIQDPVIPSAGLLMIEEPLKA